MSYDQTTADLLRENAALQAKLAEAQREINELWGDAGRKKLAEAQKDTDRLTYLEREWVADEDCPIIECEGNFFAPDSKIRTGGNIRAAIDAARKV